MCHLILFLPIIALPMLWLLPLGIGVPLYGLVLIVAVGAFTMVLRAMRRPVTAGPEALIHALAEDRSVDRDRAHVWVQGEQWAATCAEGVLVVGDKVEVIGRDGLTLQVRPHSARQVGRSVDRHQSVPDASA
jgi:membrane protein implicated in regulation of membrane protease activity